MELVLVIIKDIFKIKISYHFKHVKYVYVYVYIEDTWV